MKNKMKNLIYSTLLLISLIATSCKKEEIYPAQPIVPTPQTNVCNDSSTIKVAFIPLNAPSVNVAWAFMGYSDTALFQNGPGQNATMSSQQIFIERIKNGDFWNVTIAPNSSSTPIEVQISINNVIKVDTIIDGWNPAPLQSVQWYKQDCNQNIVTYIDLL